VIPEDLDFLLMGVEIVFHETKGRPDRGLSFRQPSEKFAASFVARSLSNSAGDCPGGVNFPSPELFDDILSELTKSDPRSGEFGLSLDNAKQISLGWVAVKPEQQIGATEMEKTEGMRLENLPQVHRATKFDGGNWWAEPKDPIARLGRAKQMTDRANTADPGGQAWHLTEWPPDAESLKPTEFNNVETSIAYLAIIP
jgi:hypothetical protein